MSGIKDKMQSLSRLNLQGKYYCREKLEGPLAYIILHNSSSWSSQNINQNICVCMYIVYSPVVHCFKGHILKIASKMTLVLLQEWFPNRTIYSLCLKNN